MLLLMLEAAPGKRGALDVPDGDEEPPIPPDPEPPLLPDGMAELDPTGTEELEPPDPPVGDVPEPVVEPEPPAEPLGDSVAALTPVGVPVSIGVPAPVLKELSLV